METNEDLPNICLININMIFTWNKQTRKKYILQYDSMRFKLNYNSIVINININKIKHLIHDNMFMEYTV